MVIQAGLPLIFRGTETYNPGKQTNITVEVLTRSGVTLYPALVHPDSSWFVEFDPMPYSHGIIITVASAVSPSIQLTDVSVGEVFLCGGQSNMEMRVVDAFNASQEVADAGNYPFLRLFTIQRNQSTTPINTFVSRFPNGQLWVPSSPDIIKGDGQYWTYFSATCYFFAREMYKKLNGMDSTTYQAFTKKFSHLMDDAMPDKIAVGVMETCWSGTRIEVWSNPQAMAQCPQPQSFEPAGYTPDDTFPYNPSLLWNAMVNPLLPFSLRGFVWYQGESNCYHPHFYACQMRALINSWRSEFTTFASASEAPFGLVVIASTPVKDTGCPGNYSLLRDSQLEAASSDVGVYPISAVDLGDHDSGLGAIHPRNKQEVGRRLGSTIAYNVFGIGKEYSVVPPLVMSYLFPPQWPLGFSSLTMQIEFFFPEQSFSLSVSDTESCTDCCKGTGALLTEWQDGSGKPVTAWTSSFSTIPGVLNETLTGQFQVSGTQFPAGTAFPLTLERVSHARADFVECMIKASNGIPAWPAIYYDRQNHHAFNGKIADRDGQIAGIAILPSGIRHPQHEILMIA